MAAYRLGVKAFAAVELPVTSIKVPEQSEGIEMVVVYSANGGKKVRRKDLTPQKNSR